MVLLLTTISGCAEKKQEDEKIILRVTYGLGETGGEEDFDAVYGPFLETHPNCEIELVDGIDSSKLMSMIAAGNTPDILRISGVNDIPGYVQKGILMELDEYIEKSDNINMDNWATVNQLFRYDGKQTGSGPIYGAVKDWGADNQIWINKKLFEEAGVPLPSTTEAMTFEELAQIASQLSVIENGEVKQMGFATDTALYLLAESILQQKYQKSVWTDDFSGTNLQDPDVVETMRYFYDMQKSGAMASELNKITPSTWFLEGKLAMYMGGYWIGGYMRTDTNMGITQEDVLLLPAPVVNKGDTCSYSFAATGAGISSTTEHPQEAYELWEYLHFGQMAEERTKRGFGLPADTTLNDLLPGETEFDRQTRDSAIEAGENLKIDIRINPYVGATAVSAAIDKYYIPALYDTMTLEDALRSADEELTLLIEEGKEIVGEQ